MQTYQTIAVVDSDLGASPELLHARLLGEGQKFLNLAISCMGTHESAGKSRNVSRVSEIIVELSGRLNHETGGELATNLVRIYRWWIDELFDANHKNEPNRLVTISSQMAEMQSTWEELHSRANRIGTH